MTMRTVRSPETAFENILKAARASGRTISVVDAKKALDELGPLSETERAAVVDAFLQSKKSDSLSDAARDVFVEARALAPSEKFALALERAAANGKVKGSITKGEAERALKSIAGTAGAATIAAEFLASPDGKKLSAGAQAAFSAFITENAPVKKPVSDNVREAFERAFGRPLDEKSAKVTALVNSIKASVGPHSTVDTVGE
jgi:hypothetical protein